MNDPVLAKQRSGTLNADGHRTCFSCSSIKAQDHQPGCTRSKFHVWPDDDDDDDDDDRADIATSYFYHVRHNYDAYELRIASNWLVSGKPGRITPQDMAEILETMRQEDERGGEVKS